MDTLRSERAPDEAGSPLIDAVVERIRERLGPNEAEAAATFVRQFYRWVPLEDLAGRTTLDLYGMALAQWRLVQDRPAGQAAIRVYNPHFEQHGWQSTHTIIDVVCDDMPFLVDSITIELGRRGVGIHLIIHPVVCVRRDAGGRLLEISPPNGSDDLARESVLHAEVDRETSSQRLEELQSSLLRVLEEVRAAVTDWQPMRRQLQDAVAQLRTEARDTDDGALRESADYLDWLDANHFTFLGYQEYELVG